ncbi:MAG: Na+/H+ antiporter NhaC family protein [Lentisphaeria bacterium]|nr:Na+/H+ antiporter NhaC family protein [Lentisphaeria bacterium]
MHENTNIHPEREPRPLALMPFVVFVVFYVGLSIWANDFYKIPMPIAFLVASAAGLLMDHRRPLMDKVEIYARGMGETNIMIMCLIFILAGSFAAAAKSMGAVDSAVAIARNLIPAPLLLTGIFLVSCFISLAIGTSCGTIAALTPIAVGLVGTLKIDPAVMLGAVIGGAMFGDNMSMISDTTIAATRTQGVAMRDKFLMNLKMILPAAVIALAYYLFSGRPGAAQQVPPVRWVDIVNVLPYVLILVCALCGMNVMALLFFGTVLAGVLGIVSGSFTFLAFLDTAGKGALGMSETLIVAILAGGLLSIVRHNGGIGYLLKKIESRIAGPRGCEIGVFLLVSAVNLFTANNTVAIVIAGPIAKEFSRKFGCDPRRIASILDTASCVVQGLIPYGAQILIALGVARAAGVEVSSFAVIGALYYPMLLLAALICAILFRRTRKEPV